MLNWTFVTLFALGLSTAKVDLNSHQPLSSPSFFGEASIRIQKNSNLGFAGIRATYYNMPLQVRPIFQDRYGETDKIHDLTFSVFIGKGIRLGRKSKLLVDGGVGLSVNGGKLGFPARLTYTREYRTRRRKVFNAAVGVGVDFWPVDDLDNHEDQTTMDGDMVFSLTLAVDLPINPGPR